MKFTKDSTWREIRQDHFSLIFKYGLAEDTHIIIKKPKDKDYDSIFVEAVNIDKRDWIAECHIFVPVNRTIQW